jgi:hypothetical protein
MASSGPRFPSNALFPLFGFDQLALDHETSVQTIYYDLATFLAVAQHFNVNQLPLVYNEEEPFGRRGTSDIRASAWRRI